MGKVRYAVLGLLALLGAGVSESTRAQSACSGCGGVITIDVDLSQKSDTVWVSPVIGRSGQCCHGAGSDVCIRFNVLVHPDANLLGFTLAEPPIPPAMEYALNCGTPVSVRDPICIDGVGPHCIVYCKPGGDLLKYQITTARVGYASPDVTVGNGCSKTIWAAGYIEPSVRWNVVYPSPVYNAFLSCQSGCLQTTVSLKDGFAIPDYIDVEVTGDLQGACANADSRDTVRVYFVNDKKVEILPKEPTICYGGTGVTLSPTASGGAEPYAYAWSNGAKTKDIYATAAGTYSVTVTDATDCPAVTDAVTVRHHLSAITADAGSGEVCTSVPKVQLNGAVTVATGGIWSGGSGVFSPANTDLNASYTLSAVEVANSQANLKLTTTGNGGCPPSTDNLKITVSPTPLVNAGDDGMVCQTALELYLNGTIVGDNIGGNWSTLGSGTFSDVNALNAVYFPSQADTARGFVELVLASKANGVCSPVRDTVTIYFGNLPQTWFEFSQPACAGEPINFNDRTSVSWGVLDTWEWDFGGGSTSTLRHPVHSFSAPGTYPVKLRTTTQEGCSAEVTRNVVVSADPAGSFTYTKECFGSGVAFTNTSTGGSAWFWDFANGFVSTVKSPSGVIYPAEGNYDVKLIAISPNGCRDTVVQQVEVLPRPTADFMVDNICQGEDVTFTDKSFVDNDAIISWKWDFGNGTVSTLPNPVQTFNTAVPLNVKLVVATASCRDSIIRQVTPLKKPAFFSSPAQGCAPLSVNFFNTLQPHVFYTWDFGDGNSSNNPSPSHMFLNSGTDPVYYDVKLKARSVFGCEDEVTQQVLVYPNSTSIFDVTSTGVCSGTEVQFTNQSVNAASYYWDMGPVYGRFIDSSPQVEFTNSTKDPQFIPVKLVTNSVFGCSDTAVQYISIFPIPDNSLSLDKTTSCHPARIVFTATSGAATYYWNWGDGTQESGSNTMEHIFTNETAANKTFTISLDITSVNGCTASNTATVVVNNSPQAIFSLNTLAGCSPLTVQISNTSADASTNKWTFSDGVVSNSASPLFSHQFVNTGTTQKSYDILLEVENAHGCKHSQSRSVVVYPEVSASFTQLPAQGCSPLLSKFTNTSIGGDSYRWIFGDGGYSTNQHAEHTYLNDSPIEQIMDVQLIAVSAFGCIDTSAVKNIRIYPSPVADFAIGSASGCSPFEVQIVDKTVGATDLQWDISGAPSTSGSLASYTFSNRGSSAQRQTITLHAVNQYGCTDTSMQTLTVFPEVTAWFSPQVSGCSPLTVQFLNASTNGFGYSWSFGDGAKSTIAQPAYTFINNTVNDRRFDVELTAVSNYGCTDMASVPITVYGTPDADFALQSSFIQYPDTEVQISNLTSGDWYFSWDMGDGTKRDNVREPGTHSYPGLGNYTIVLVARSPQCADTAEHTVQIFEAEITVDYDTSYAGCAPISAQFTNKSEHATWYLWDFGDGTTSAEKDPLHIYETPGTYIVELRAGNLSTEKISRKHTVEVYPTADAMFSLAPEAVSLPNAAVSFYNQSATGGSYTWYFGTGDSSHEFAPIYNYQKEGTYDIALYVVTDKGCRDSLIKPAAVRVTLDCMMRFPNAFTPSDSEISGKYDPSVQEIDNDIFHPLHRNITEYQLQMFNRWGELVFESTDINTGWNGYFKGKLSKQDTYVWQVEATCIGGKKINQSGSVTLLR